MVTTTSGKKAIVTFLGGTAVTEPTHMAFGTDGTEPSEGDTTLTTENTRKAIATTIASGQEVKYTATILTTESIGITFKELGLFNASTAGTMFNRITFSNIDKTASFDLQATITLRVD